MAQEVPNVSQLQKIISFGFFSKSVIYLSSFLDRNVQDFFLTFADQALRECLDHPPIFADFICEQLLTNIYHNTFGRDEMRLFCLPSEVLIIKPGHRTYNKHILKQRTYEDIPTWNEFVKAF